MDEKLLEFAEKQLLKLYDLSGSLKRLPGYDDFNFRITTGKGRYVLKFYSNCANMAFLLAEMKVLNHLNKQTAETDCYPKPIAAIDGIFIHPVTLPSGKPALMYMLSFIEGEMLSQAVQNESCIQSLGVFLANMHLQLALTSEPAIAAIETVWDMQRCLESEPSTTAIPNPEWRRLANYFFQCFRTEVQPLLPGFKRQIIHNDGNDWNVLCKNDKVSGIIDFGDLVKGPRVQDVATALYTILLAQKDPLAVATWFLHGYASIHPLDDIEIDSLYYMIAARLSVSLTQSCLAKQQNRGSAYIEHGQQSAADTLKAWVKINPKKASQEFAKANKNQAILPDSTETLLAGRQRWFSKALGLSYHEPIQMIGAAMQYMYGSQGNSYLDCVNNIMHVGHCHPKVVQAGQAQMARLNTNTRYLYPQLTAYAEQLLAYFPDSLNRVLFVNSGSAAGDLAIHMAQSKGKASDLLVMEHGYHGNSLATLAASSYKYNGPGGQGRQPWIHEIPMPDLVRKHNLDPRIPESCTGSMAGLIHESILGCGGQMVLPDGYLQQLYAKVRAQGGLCIADEVQTGFGRLGHHFWAFESQGVVPDLVVLGKPMGNGHPMGAVVFGDAVAEGFENGMEFFSSFGGNPVSCAVGMAVLDVIEDEGLQAHAATLGDWLLAEFRQLQEQFEVIADVRGSGLFLGIELVMDRASLKPNVALANQIIEDLKTKKILLSTDGPQHNVLKFKPPMVFNYGNAQRLVRELSETLNKHTQPIH